MTGGGSGIGLAIAQVLAAHGAQVHILGRDAKRLAAAAPAIGSGLPASQLHACDVRDAGKMAEVATRLAQAGGCDILVNAAAGNFPAPFDALSANAWDAVLAIVLGGTVNATRALAGQLKASQSPGGGCIVNIVAGYAWTGAPGVSHSGAAKAAVLNLSRSLAVEWAPAVRVNAVSPGPIDGTEGMKRLADDLGMRPAVEAAVPMRRMGQAREVADAVLWLASPAASFVTGACIVVDGGMDAKGPFGGLLAG